MSENAQVSPPYELRSSRITVRCWQPVDAPLFKDAIDSSLDHLRPWMPWAHHEPQSVDEKVDLLRRFRGRFDLGEDFVYGIFTADGSRVLGGCGLHRRSGVGTLEIGYWIRADATGQGLATETVRLLTKAAFTTCDIERLDILVEPDNAASAAIPRKLGFTEEARLRRHLPSGHAGEPMRDALVFTLLAEEFVGSAMAAIELHAFDCRGEPIDLNATQR